MSQNPQHISEGKFEDLSFSCHMKDSAINGMCALPSMSYAEILIPNIMVLGGGTPCKTDPRDLCHPVPPPCPPIRTL